MASNTLPAAGLSKCVSARLATRTTNSSPQSCQSMTSDAEMYQRSVGCVIAPRRRGSGIRCRDPVNDLPTVPSDPGGGLEVALACIGCPDRLDVSDAQDRRGRQWRAGRGIEQCGDAVTGHGVVALAGVDNGLEFQRAVGQSWRETGGEQGVAA